MALRRPVVLNNNASYGGYAEEAPTGDTLDQRGDIAMNANFITGLADPVTAQGAATKAYVDSVATGLDVKTSVRLATTAALPAVTAAGAGVGKTLTANAVGVLTVDGVAPGLNEDVLVKNQATAADNGIYRLTTLGTVGVAFVLTRRTDADSNAEVTGGMFTFVAEGTVNADTGWVLTTNDPLVLDTTGLAFSQFSSVATLTYDAGLVKSGTSIAVEVDTTAAAQTAGADGGSSGLEFDVTGAAGKLRAAVNATGGLQRSASGLSVLLNNGSLSTGAAGLSVNYAPKVQDNTYVSNEALVAFQAVAMSTTNDRVQQARGNSDARAKVIGLNLTTAGAAGAALQVVESGVVVGAITGATAGDIYWVQAAGGIGTTLPSGGNRRIQIGIAKNATDLIVQVLDYNKAA